MQAMIAAHLRQRLLAGLTRSGLLAVLRDSGGQMKTREPADAVGLHPNSVREQLARLADAGLIATETAPPSGRSRTRLRYGARLEGGEQASYRALAGALAEDSAGWLIRPLGPLRPEKEGVGR